MRTIPSSQSSSSKTTPKKALAQQHESAAQTQEVMQSAFQNSLQEEAVLLFRCATSSSSTLQSPSPSRLRKCQYPSRFSKLDTGSLTLLLFAAFAAGRAAAGDDGFTGQWNGKWTASSYDDQMYDDADGSDNKVYSMWKDDDSLEPKISADQITLYATVGILGLMLVLFCCCHPEILIVLCRNFKNYLCRRRKRWGNNTVSNAVGEDYVGGVQIEKREDKESERDVI